MEKKIIITRDNGKVFRGCIGPNEDRIILWSGNAKPKKYLGKNCPRQGQSQFLEKEDIWYRPYIFEEDEFVSFEKDIFEIVFGFLPKKGSLQKMKLTNILDKERKI